MSVKAILVFCALALFVQSALSQCTSRAAVADRGYIGSYGLGDYGLAGGYGLGRWGWDGAYGLDRWGWDGAYGLGGCGYGGPGIDFSPTSGGGLLVSSASAIAPVGLTVASENVYEGILASAGELPFVGTVGVEGVLPTAGAGAINHHCGDGINAMVSDGWGYGGFGYDGAYGLGYDGAYGLGYDGAFGLGLGGRGLGYRGWAGKGCGWGIY